MICTNPCICQCQKQNIRTQLIVLTYNPSIRKIRPDFKGPTVAMIPKHMQIKSHYMNKPLHHAQTRQNLVIQNKQITQPLQHISHIQHVSDCVSQKYQKWEQNEKQNIAQNSIKQTKRQTLKKPINPMQSSIDYAKTRRRRHSYYPQLTMKLLQRQNNLLRKQYSQLKKQQKQLLNFKEKCRLQYQTQKDKFYKNKDFLQKSCTKRFKQIQQLKQLFLICRQNKQNK